MACFVVFHLKASIAAVILRYQVRNIGNDARNCYLHTIVGLQVVEVAKLSLTHLTQYEAKTVKRV